MTNTKTKAVLKKPENPTLEEHKHHLWRLLSPKIRWEKNSLVDTNPRIDPKSIIPKSSTSEYPAGKMTIKVASMKNRRFKVYAYSDKETRTNNWGGRAYTYTSIHQALKTYVDCSRQYSDNTIYSTTGEMPYGLDFEKLDFVCKYAEDILGW